MPSDLMGPDLEVHLPGLRAVPDMFDRQAEASQRCHDHAEDAYGAMDYGPGPLRNATAGIINYLAGTHDRIRSEVTGYFDEVNEFATAQGGSVQESVDLYETTDMEIAAMLDASMFLPGRREEVVELGRSPELDAEREMATSLEPRAPADALKPFTDHRAEIPFQPDWLGGGIARDTIWQITYIATQLGLMSRPVDIVADLIVPFTGDWAGVKTCGDALTDLANAASDLHANTGWIELRIDAVWKGNAADACWLQTRRLQHSLFQAPTVLDGYAAAYEDVVARIYELEQRAAEVLAQALDWAIAALFGRAARTGGHGDQSLRATDQPTGGSAARLHAAGSRAARHRSGLGLRSSG